MYILTQDCEDIIEIQKICMITRADQRVGIVANNTDIVGTYSDEERAKQILKDILRRIDTGIKTYIMPKE